MSGVGLLVHHRLENNVPYIKDRVLHNTLQFNKRQKPILSVCLPPTQAQNGVDSLGGHGRPGIRNIIKE